MTKIGRPGKRTKRSRFFIVLNRSDSDQMFHSVKDIFGVFLSEVHVENLRELSSIGSDDIQQQLPYLY